MTARRVGYPQVCTNWIFIVFLNFNTVRVYVVGRNAGDATAITVYTFVYIVMNRGGSMVTDSWQGIFLATVT